MIHNSDILLFNIVYCFFCMKMTPAQQTVFDMMRKHGVLTDDYYDLTKQREKVREAREQKENRKQ